MLKKYLYLFICGAIFGSQYIITREALAVYTPLEVGTMRVVFGTLMVCLLAPFFPKEKKNLNVAWHKYALVGFLEGTLPCILVSWGQVGIPSSVVAVIISMMPIFAMLFAPLILRSEKYSLIGISSILIGFTGVAILINPTSSAFSIAKLVPELAVLLAAISWALAIILIKRLPTEAPVRLTRNILIAATIQILPIWFIFGRAWHFTLHPMPLFYGFLLGSLASGIVYIFYVLLIRLGGVNFAAFSTYITPIVGGTIGILFLEERFTLLEFIGFGVVIIALCIQAVHDFLRGQVED